MLTLVWQSREGKRPQATINGEIVDDYDQVFHKILSIIDRGIGRPYQYDGARYFIYSIEKAMDLTKVELLTLEEAAARFKRYESDFIWE